MYTFELQSWRHNVEDECTHVWSENLVDYWPGITCTFITYTYICTLRLSCSCTVHVGMPTAVPHCTPSMPSLCSVDITTSTLPCNMWICVNLWLSWIPYQSTVTKNLGAINEAFLPRGGGGGWSESFWNNLNSRALWCNTVLHTCNLILTGILTELCVNRDKQCRFIMEALTVTPLSQLGFETKKLM